LESLIQLIKTMALQRWPHLVSSHRFRMGTGCRHHWTYRGQIIPENKRVTVEALITHAAEGPSPTLRADGLLRVDGLPIYKMNDFELTLAPRTDIA
jgi:hypothetical protein